MLELYEEEKKVMQNGSLSKMMTNKTVNGKRIIIDIDNTLWDFAPVLWEGLKEVNSDVPDPSEWNHWDFWKEYVSEKVLYRKIREIHIRQEMFLPFTDAEVFLSSLKDSGHHIIIASHRDDNTFDITERWLRKFNLIFDEIHLSHDKSVLFSECYAVVDDSPLLLGEAMKSGLTACGLKKPWNNGFEYPLFESLFEVFEYLKVNPVK